MKVKKKAKKNAMMIRKGKIFFMIIVFSSQLFGRCFPDAELYVQNKATWKI